MMCYRDRTYCSAPCVALGCDRMPSLDDLDHAKTLSLPLALSDFRDTCGRYVPPRSPSPREGTP